MADSVDARAVARRRLAAFAVVTVLAACTSAPASESPSPSATAPPASAPVVGEGEEWIVFQGVSDLSLIRVDGSGNHPLLDSPGDHVHADWAPDGLQIAVVEDTGVSMNVNITDAHGSEPTDLVAEYPTEAEGLFWDNPAWSRDGSRIAMIGYEGNPIDVAPSGSVLAIVDVTTGELTVAHRFSGEERLHSFPRWSPDGSALVMNIDHFDGSALLGSTIGIIRREGDGWSVPTEITEIGDFSRVDWHPTEDLIVYCTADIGGLTSTSEPSNLFTIRPDGGERTQVTDFQAGEERATQPTWTTDGRIIFTLVAGAEDEDRSVAFINADGTGMEVVIEPDLVGQFNRPHPRLRPTTP